MMSNWVNLLEEAEGRSEHVIALSMDIRGFTQFCEIKGESVDIATYITKVYEKILTGYFQDVTYSKPMGDGLFIIVKCHRKDIKNKVNELMDMCIALVNDFNSICNDEDIIKPPIPDKIGIGITWGSACCIHNEDTIIDYSGRTLNFAARLMDKARPYGIVCDFNSFNKLLNPDLKSLFYEDEVILRGISEKEPIKVLAQQGMVIFSEDDKKPINEIVWKTEKFSYTFSELEVVEKIVILTLKEKTIDPKSIFFWAQHPKYKDGEKMQVSARKVYTLSSKTLKFSEIGDVQNIYYDLTEIKTRGKKEGLKKDDIIKLTVKYRI